MSERIKKLIALRVRAEEAYGKIEDFHSQKQKQSFEEVYQEFLKYRAELRQSELRGRELSELGRVTEEIGRLAEIIGKESRKGQRIVT
jgi:hypothetical protein